ncbi:MULTISPECIES: DUF3991 and TOPRIM domain-containing protein [unclassified Breznakia]|uniref:DUF3991 and TOPRIM domain-containing protein n=1 Tax=unclassified Breznakia TaxID=2623764 RepID=UPI002474C287|nr:MULTISPECIES: DUF3991 and TOPRIM domain-containing protein [unclassified Breznakia]MDH6367379.1 hypothetical protein [Breznakia sp. PH1-1]MDH6403911.1 hypothetical protein [Breznakia sp. PF1-11]MDH6411620.1 hypothetical protein [Breznakia sp. PFB1-11]MDH6414546.1 hypothetical protein [Breznakia sp. PFB1-14]MDH6418652.1 hypothetical protein [Breznakia sp. PFB1-12]
MNAESTNNKMKFYSKEEKEARAKHLRQVVKDVSVAELASNLYGLLLEQAKKGARYLKCKEHGSMVFDLKTNKCYWNAKTGSTALNPIDFIMVYENLGGGDAIRKLLNYHEGRDQEEIEHFVYDEKHNETYKTTGMITPIKNINNDKVITYLHEVRGLKKNLIQALISKNMLYQDVRNNCVFIGYNKDNEVEFGCLRGTSTNKFQMDCKGSRKMVGYYVQTDKSFDTLVVCESVIDGLSYMSLNPQSKANVLCASGAGNVTQTLMYHLLERKPDHVKKVILALDNDNAGREGAKSTTEWLKEFHPNIAVEQLQYNGKDLNEALLTSSSHVLQQEKVNSEMLTDVPKDEEVEQLS